MTSLHICPTCWYKGRLLRENGVGNCLALRMLKGCLQIEWAMTGT